MGSTRGLRTGLEWVGGRYHGEEAVEAGWKRKRKTDDTACMSSLSSSLTHVLVIYLLSVSLSLFVLHEHGMGFTLRLLGNGKWTRLGVERWLARCFI